MTKCQITFLQSQYKLAKIIPIEDSNHEPIEINMATYKGFHNDIIEFDFETNKVIKIIETNIKNIDIVGVLMIKSNYKYGYNRSKAPIYLFKPFDFKYPNFLVASNIKKKQKVKENQFAVIQYHKWERKIPNGMIKQMIGSVGELKSEYNAILHKYNLNKYPPKIKKLFKAKNISDIFGKDLDKYTDIRTLNVVSIDPPNCTDIDDALSIETNSEGHLIGIHIANVSAFIEKFDLFEKIIERCTTVYAPHKKINMIPNILSDNFASLLEGKERISLTLWIHIDNDFNITGYKFQECLLVNKKAYSYNKAQKNLKKDKTLQSLYNISKHLAKNINYNYDEYDMHKMIEVYMILANHLTAKHLIENNSPCIFRTHKSREHNIDFKSIDTKLIPFLKIFQSNAAEYTTYQGDYYHYGLNIHKYTHFTSPIRRLPDILIHMLIKQLIGKFKMTHNIEQICQNCNDVSKKIKKMNRDLKRIDIVKNTNTETIYDAHIISLDENKVTIYCTELKFCDRIFLFDTKMSDVIEITRNDNTIIITNKQTEKSTQLELYQKIKVKMIGIIDNISIKNKLIVKILEPDLNIIM
tara:strand:+ start:4034 stop:5779 length:1746 start_codon:yes stop_codon:yes gene_type:complete